MTSIHIITNCANSWGLGRSKHGQWFGGSTEVEEDYIRHLKKTIEVEKKNMEPHISSPSQLSLPRKGINRAGASGALSADLAFQEIDSHLKKIDKYVVARDRRYFSTAS